MTHHKKSHIATLAFLLCVGAASWPPASLAASVPEFLTYQGRLEQGSIPFTGDALFKFAIVTSSGGVLYTHDGSAGPEPNQSVVRSVDRGVFTIHIGSQISSTENMRSVPAGVFAEPRTFLRVWVAAPPTAPIEELIEATFPVPHAHQFASVPYSVTAQQLAGGTTQIIQQVIITSATIERVSVSSTLAIGQGTITLGSVNQGGVPVNTIEFSSTDGEIKTVSGTALNIGVNAGASGSVNINPTSVGNVTVAAGGGKVGIGRTPTIAALEIKNSGLGESLGLYGGVVSDPFLRAVFNTTNGGMLWMNRGFNSGSATLHVQSAGPLDLFRLEDVNSALRFYVTKSGTAGVGELRIEDPFGLGNAPARLSVSQSATTGTKPLLLASSGSPLQTRFVVQPDGKVGIGTGVPGAILEIREASPVGSQEVISMITGEGTATATRFRVTSIGDIDMSGRFTAGGLVTANQNLNVRGTSLLQGDVSAITPVGTSQLTMIAKNPNDTENARYAMLVAQGGLPSRSILNFTSGGVIQAMISAAEFTPRFPDIAPGALRVDQIVFNRLDQAAGIGDIAEKFESVENLREGTVVEVDPERDGHVVACREPRSPNAFGVVTSTTSAMVLGAGRRGVPVGIAGRLRALVSAKNGPVRRGKDLTPNGEGGLMAADVRTPPRGIFGRALQEMKVGEGLIEIVITGR